MTPDIYFSGITLDIYENEITCILGHNGAGKTSLMNMLTGLTPPTAGTALIYGHVSYVPLRYIMCQLKQNTGICYDNIHSALPNH